MPPQILADQKAPDYYVPPPDFQTLALACNLRVTPPGSVGPVNSVLRMPQQFHVKLQEPKALAESTQPFSILAAKKAPLGHRQTSKTAW